MLLALAHARRLRGESQPQLMRCVDGKRYVVKFQNNPQGIRVLANELLGTKLAAFLGLPVFPPRVVHVSDELIEGTKGLSVRRGAEHFRCTPGLQFGSLYSGSSAAKNVSLLFPPGLLHRVSNIEDFWGMLVFDKWTCNTDQRQVVFLPEESSGNYRAVMIDNGYCFNGPAWDFPDAPLRGLYPHGCAYKDVRGLESFAPWFERIQEVSLGLLCEAAAAVPREWLNSRGRDEFEGLLERLWIRRTRVPQLVLASVRCCRDLFPGWREPALLR